MFAITSLRLSAALIITSALAALLALVAFSPAAQAHHSWGKYHWARTTTDGSFNLKLGDNVSSSTWDSSLSKASTDWSVSSVLDTTVVPGTTTTCTPTFGIGRVEVCNAAYGTNGWLGLAQIWVSRRHIVAGTTKVNDTYFSPGGKYDTDAWRQMVMCQEVGHTFGLDYQDEIFQQHQSRDVHGLHQRPKRPRHKRLLQRATQPARLRSARTYLLTHRQNNHR